MEDFFPSFPTLRTRANRKQT